MELYIQPEHLARILIIGAATCLTTRILPHPLALMNLFTKGRVSAWRCNGVFDREVGTPYETCEAQSQVLTELSSIVMGCEMLGSIISGLLMDSLGEQLTCLIGLAAQCTAMLFFIFDSETLPLLALGGILSGLSINCIGNAAFTLTKIFPNGASIITSYIMCSQTLSAIVLPTIEKFWDAMPAVPFKQVLGGYTMLVILPMGLAYTWAVGVPSDSATQLEDDQEDKKTLLASSSDANLESMEHIGEVKQRRQSLIECYKSTGDMSSALEKAAMQSESLFSILTSPVFIVFVELIIAAWIATGFYMLRVQRALGKDSQAFLTSMQAAQVLFLILWGLAADLTHPLVIIAAHFIGFAGMYMFALAESPATEYISCILFLIHLPFSYALKYIFIMRVYPADHRNILFGVIGGVCGLVSIALASLNRIGSISSWCATLAIMSTIHLLPIAWLFVRMRSGAQPAS